MKRRPFSEVSELASSDFSLEPPILDLLGQPAGTVLLRDAVFVPEEAEPFPWLTVMLAMSLGFNIGQTALMAAIVWAVTQ